MRPPQHLCPVLEVRPRLLWRTATEGWETSEELEEYATKTPVIDGVSVWFTAQNLRCHVIGGADYGVSVAGIFITDGAVNRTALKSRAVYYLVVFDIVELFMVRKMGIKLVVDEVPTLILRDSIRFGLRAPVARPKSVNFTCPVPSTRKFWIYGKTNCAFKCTRGKSYLGF